MSNIDGELNTVQDDIKKLRGDISTLSEAIRDLAAQRFRSTVNEAQQKIDYWTENARKRSRDSLEDLAAEIEDRPLTSMLVAFGAGVILGRLFQR